MTTPRGRSDFDYGNTRLRARRSEILRAADYETLLGQDVDGMLAVLRGIGYALDADAQGPGGLNGLHLAIRAHLGRSLEQMRSFYEGRARALVDVLLSRFDLHNVITLLRSRSRPDITVDEGIIALIPIGWVSEPVARQVLTAEQLIGVADHLADLTPYRGQASALRLASSEYERTGDFAGLERSVLAEHAARVAELLGRPAHDDAALHDLVQLETDQHNLLVSLRLREAVLTGADDTPPPKETVLVGGTLSTDALAKAVTAEARTTVIDLLAGQAPTSWLPALEQWSSTGDISVLQRSLERGTVALATGLFVKGDPLAVDLPVAFTVAKQLEARNLRVLAEGAATGIAPPLLRSELLLVGSST